MSSKISTAKIIKFTSPLDKFSPESGWHFIAVSKDIADRLAFEGRNRRVVCTLNGAETYQCALMPYQGDFFLMVNKRVRTKLKIEHGDNITVELVRDDSQYGMVMPEEFREVLNQDPDADRLFHDLTVGKQRSLIYLVTNVKDIDRRIHNALLIVEHLKQNDGKVNGERLYEEIKRPLM